MSNHRTQIRKPANESDFEENCVVLFRGILNDPSVQRLGTRGQRQFGVDLVGHRDQDPNQVVGIQCKLKSGRARLTTRELQEEVNKAIGYKPALNEYFVVTTSKNDTQLTQLAQKLMQDIAVTGRRMRISVWGWDTLEQQIHEHLPAREAFDPGFSPSLAEQDLKLDTVISGLERTATKEQLNDLAARVQSLSHDQFSRVPAALADKLLKEELIRALRRRGFSGADVADELIRLAHRAIDGDLSLALSTTRAEVCDRASRSAASSSQLELAVRFLTEASKLDSSRELVLANAVLEDARGDRETALRLLRSREDPDSRTVLFQLLRQQRGPVAALTWLRDARVGPVELNSIGVVNLLVTKIQNGAFEEALVDVRHIPSHHFTDSPVLLLLRAQLRVSESLPVDRRPTILRGLPVNPREFQLEPGQHTEEGIEAALSDIHALRASLDWLHLTDLIPYLSEFELWLRLEHQITRADARNQLVRELADPELALQRIRLALAYDAPFKKEALARHLKAQSELGGWTSEQRLAAFLLAYHSKDLAEIAAFFETHHRDLFAQNELSVTGLAAMEIEILARVGRFREAREHLSEHGDLHLTNEQAVELEAFLDTLERGDELEALREKYSTSQSTNDLRILVDALCARGDPSEIAEYAPQLARQTRTRSEFGIALKALYESKKYSDAVSLAADIPNVCASDDEYQSIYAWSLYNVGSLLEARSLARELYGRRNVASDRELCINTAIETGDWGFIQGILAIEAKRTEGLSSHDLLRFARLSFEVESPYTMVFRDRALASAPEDPNVYLGAYLLEIERGEDKEPRADEWFRKAIELSGDGGPVKSASIRDIVKELPSWNAHVERVGSLLSRAELPLFAAAKSLRRQFVDVTLGQALRNENHSDSPVPFPVLAFSGTRRGQPLNGVRTAFDLSALMTLEFLGLLGNALDAFDHPLIAPKTLSALFIERQFLRVRQPSEIAKARRIQKIIADGRLKVLPDTVRIKSSETNEIGEDLASLISVARAKQGLVVRIAPVHKPGSFLDETVNMTQYQDVLVDSITVAGFVDRMGHLDHATQARARAYLEKVDSQWPHAIQIQEGCDLYLDELTVTYLDFVGVLEPLSRCKVNLFVHSNLEHVYNETALRGGQAQTLLNRIEEMRALLSSRIEAGSIQFSSRHDVGDESDESNWLGTSPTLDLLNDLSGIDVVIADDRCLNQVQFWTDSHGKNTETGCVLEVLAFLRKSNQLDDRAHWLCRHQLRRAGYFAVPLDPGELVFHLTHAHVNSGEVQETPELRAIAESLLLPLLHPTLKPDEFTWLAHIRHSIYTAIRDVWLNATEYEIAAAKALWLLNVLPNLFAWITATSDMAVQSRVRQQAAAELALLMLFLGSSRRKRTWYFEWLERSVISPLQRTRPELLDAAIEYLGTYIPTLLQPSDGSDGASPEQVVCVLAVDPLPAEIRIRLLHNAEFCARLGISPESYFDVREGISINIADLIRVIRVGLAGQKTAMLTLREGRKKVTVTHDHGGTSLRIGATNLHFDHTEILSSDRRVRLRALRRAFATTPLLWDEERAWLLAAGDHPVTDSEYLQLMTCLSETPEGLQKDLRSATQLSLRRLLPQDPNYFRRLVAPPTRSKSFDDFISDELYALYDHLTSRRSATAFRRIAFAAVSRRLIPFDLVRETSLPKLRGLLTANDPFSLLFGFELCAQRIAADTRFLRLGTSFLDLLLADPERTMERCRRYTAMAIISAANLRQSARASGAPVFWVRLASLTHAGVLTDALNPSISGDKLVEWAQRAFGPTYVWSSVVDRQGAPQWSPDWINPEQLNLELIGRVMRSVEGIPASTRPPQWTDAIKTALKPFQDTGRAWMTSIPGPFDDLPRLTETDSSLLAFEDQLAGVSQLFDAGVLFPLAYLTRPSKRVVDHVLRLLSAFEPTEVSEADEVLGALSLCAHLAGTARSVALAQATIDHCLLSLRQVVGVSARALLDVIAEACAANEELEEYRRMLGASAARLCFVADNPDELKGLVDAIDLVGQRDEACVPALARARAIAGIKLRRRRSS